MLRYCAEMSDRSALQVRHCAVRAVSSAAARDETLFCFHINDVVDEPFKCRRNWMFLLVRYLNTSAPWDRSVPSAS